MRRRTPSGTTAVGELFRLGVLVRVMERRLVMRRCRGMARVLRRYVCVGTTLLGDGVRETDYANEIREARYTSAGGPL